MMVGQSVVDYWYQKTKGKKYNYQDINDIRKNLKDQGFESRSIVNAIYYLQYRKYISLSGTSGARKVILTTKGGLQYIKYCPLTTAKILKKPHKSIVILSIPEDKRDLRDFLRRRLTENQFRPFSGSVYESNYQISSNFVFLVRFLGLRGLVELGEFLTLEIR